MFFFELKKDNKKKCVLKSYTMDCYFRQEWKDSRLAFDGPFAQISLSMKMLELIWKPGENKLL